MIDAKSNFMLLMSLLDLTPAQIAADLGTDVTLISRWRTGQRRLVPGRSWGPKVAAYFVRKDSEHPAPVLRTLLAALYPEKPLQTQDELVSSTLQFLYCPGQMEYRYRLHRYMSLNDALPGRLAPPWNPDEEVDHMGVWTTGILKTQSAIMEYLSAFCKPNLPPERMILVSPQGLNPILAIDDRFAAKFIERLQHAFALGHRLTMVVAPKYHPTGSDGLLTRFEGMHLRGSLETKISKEFGRRLKLKETFILTSKDRICVSVILPEGEPSQARALTVKSPVTCAKTHLMALRLANMGYEHYSHQLLEDPQDFFAGLRNQARDFDGAMYMLSDVPLLGAMRIDTLQDLYGLTDEEAARFAAQFELFMLRAVDMPNARPRYVLCRDEIERVLVTDDLHCVEMSRILGREVHLNREGILKLLKGLLAAMNEADWMEVALLPRHIMKMVDMRAILMEGKLALGIAADGHTTGTKDEDRLVWCMKYGSMVWNHIPPGMKKRSVSMEILMDLVEQYEGGAGG